MRKVALIGLVIFALFSLVEMDRSFILLWETHSSLRHSDIIFDAVVLFICPLIWVVFGAVKGWQSN